MISRLLLAAAAALAACLPAHAQLIEHGLLPRPDGSSIAYYLKQRDAARAADSLLVVMQGSDCNSVAHNRAIREDVYKRQQQAAHHIRITQQPQYAASRAGPA